MGTGVSNPGANEGISAKSYGPQSGTRALSNHDVSVYGTGTGSQFSNVNANSLGAANRTPNNQMQSYTDNGLRALETTSTKPIQWGWLGLLGLFGLFGARNRNSERSK
jgi:MYXO-CTERM domain-containing protein